MRHLNYSHLQYFWTVASEGSIARASKTLHLTPQTISGQLKLLEEMVGEPLFEKVGRGLALTTAGWVAWHGWIGQAAALWSYFLVQSLYFLLPMAGGEGASAGVGDEFERARDHLLALLDEA